MMQDPALTLKIVRQAEELDFKAIVLTIDSPVSIPVSNKHKCGPTSDIRAEEFRYKFITINFINYLLIIPLIYYK